MGSIVFHQGKTNMVSQSFKTPATIAGFNIAPTVYEQDDNGLTTNVECGDYITFERILTASDYNVDCNGFISSDGVIASIPLKDECGDEVQLDACHNTITINIAGTYRAIYHGNGRDNAIVTKD